MIATAALRLVSQHSFAEVLLDEANGHQGLYSTAAFNPDDVVCTFSAKETFNRPSYLTIQTGEQTHITLAPEFLQYINHSCEPNVFFDIDTWELICLRPVLPGEQFTFFYPSTEWQMDRPFPCSCGSSQCADYITGAADMDWTVLQNQRCSSFIQNKLRQR